MKRSQQPERVNLTTQALARETGPSDNCCEIASEMQRHRFGAGAEAITT